MAKKDMEDSLLKKIFEIDSRLSELQDFNSILETTLTEVRKFVHADAGSIYLLEKDMLSIRYAQNDTQKASLREGEPLPYVAFSFPVTEKSIVGYCVISKKILNIADAYDIPETAPYRFNQGSDMVTGYKTKSTIAVPLKVASGRIVGVLQIINALDENKNIRPFTSEDEDFISHFATVAATAIERAESVNLVKSVYREQKLQRIFEIDQQLNEIQDIDVLLESILTEARLIVNADAGSIYEIEGDKLSIKYAQNDTQAKQLKKGEKLPYVSFSFPITEKSVAGYCVKSHTLLNIHDAYNLPEGVPYSFNKNSDLTTGYHTKSMLTIPLKIADSSVLGVLQIINAKDKDGNTIEFDEDAELFITHFAANVANALEHTKSRRDLIETMTSMANMRDPRETGLHVARVSKFSVEIYDRWAFNHGVKEDVKLKFRDFLAIASKCHDFGKIGIEDMILKKPGRFTDEERSIMNGHTCLGAQLFENFHTPVFDMCREVNLRHHEWWDGTNGYPGKVDYLSYEQGTPLPKTEALKGDEIPLSARIVAVADVFDALCHRRVYKDAWTIGDAVSEIQRLSGTQFDPEIVTAFMQIKDRLITISDSMN